MTELTTTPVALCIAVAAADGQAVAARQLRHLLQHAYSLLDVCYDVFGRDADAVAHDNEWTVVDRGLAQKRSPDSLSGSFDDALGEGAAGSEDSFQTDDAARALASGELVGDGNCAPSDRPSPLLERQPPPAAAEELAAAPQEAAVEEVAVEVARYPSDGMSMYDDALSLAESGGVNARRMRIDETGCRNRIEFLARVHCIRQACDHMLADPKVRSWFQETGRSMLSRLLAAAGQATDDFVLAFDRLNAEVVARANTVGIEVALREYAGRGVTNFTFFDMVIDYYILDAFDDIKKLPAAATSVIASGWVPLSVKQKVGFELASVFRAGEIKGALVAAAIR